MNRWYSQIQENENNWVNIPNKENIPVFLEIDTNTFNVDSLLNWGIELISEEEGGFIIGASFDKLELFQKNVGQFLADTGRYRNSAAQIWSFASDESWRLENIVKGPLKENWGNISDNQTYDIEITVSCPLGQMKDYPNRSDFDSEAVFQQKVEEYRQQEQQLWQERDEKQRDREVEVGGYLGIYNGEVLDLWDNGVDAVAFKIAITGQGLKHIVFTYQYLYEAKFSSVFNVETNVNNESIETELEIIAPDEDAPKVCVIDSGIQEYHRLISPAIDAASSRSYLENDVSTADHVRQSGHGTKVAGLILYPRQIPSSGQYQLETFIQNARILDANGEISRRKFAPKLMEKIVEDYSPTKIFNLSVCDDCSYSGAQAYFTLTTCPQN